MRALDRKLLRDLGRMKGQALSIALVVGCGIASFVATVSTYRSLVASRDAYYAQSRFPELFARAQRAPLSLLERLRALPGVAAAEGRLAEAARLEVPGFAEPVWGRVASVDPEAAAPLGALFLRRGRLPERGRGDEAVVGEAFALAHALAPGDALWAVLEGKRVRLRVVGVGLSPEYVWVVPPGGIFADDLHYGVLWMDREALASAAGMRGAFDDLALQLAPGASSAEVADAVERLLEPWGSYGAYDRRRQASDRLVSQELAQLETSATLVPLVFLGVAALLLNVLLSRVVATQREQIAALKALGYTNRQLGAHYAALALAVVGAGALLGTGPGAWAGRAFVNLYGRYFRFPVLSYRLEPLVPVAAVAISAAAGLLGTLGAVRRVVRLASAEAMRPEPPARYRPALLERLGLGRALPVAARMVLRDLERQPGRALLSALAVGLATAILMVGRMAFDSVDQVMRAQFEQAQREDLAVTFTRPLEDRVRRSLALLPGVTRVERQRDAPVRLRAGPRSRETVLLGVDPAADLRRPLDALGRPLLLPEGALALSRPLGEALGVAPGDPLELEVLEGGRPRRTLPVGALVDDPLGTVAYLRLGALDRLLGGAPADSGAVLAVERPALDEAERALGALPEVVSVVRRERLRELFTAQMAGSFLTIQLVLTVFAAVIAVGVVYNNARIALAVRARDLATLRILGLTRGEVAAVLLGEQAVQLALGLPLGLPLGRLLGRVFLGSTDRELFRLPVLVSGQARAAAVTAVLLAGAVSALLVRRRADRLDLVSVLKARD